MKFLILCTVCGTIFIMVSAEDSCGINGQTLKKGETHQPLGKCELLECTDHGLAKKICPITFGYKGCLFMAADFSKPYPDCCLRIECPKDKPPLTPALRLTFILK